MKTSNKGFDQCGNAQAVVNENQIIVAADVTGQANDMRQVAPMLEQTHENQNAAGVNEKPKEFLAHAGYFSEENVNTVESAGMTPFIATQRLKHHETIPAAPTGRTPGNLSLKQKMARKQRTKKSRETYTKRKWMIEPAPFRTQNCDQMKACRHFQNFS